MTDAVLIAVLVGFVVLLAIFIKVGLALRVHRGGLSGCVHRLRLIVGVGTSRVELLDDLRVGAIAVTTLWMLLRSFLISIPFRHLLTPFVR
jgi:hypothetical protein